jgi:hypothetical protein
VGSCENYWTLPYRGLVSTNHWQLSTSLKETVG